MAGRLEGLPVAFLAAMEGTEQVELTEPWENISYEAGTPKLISQRSGEVSLFSHLDRAGTWPVDATLETASADDFAALVLPGGVANPDQLRMDQQAVEFVREFVAAGKPIAVICHGPWTLIEADAVRGRTITSYPSLRTDLRNAGATWVDQEVVVCDHGPYLLISSRNPNDLPAFCRTLVERFSRQTAGAR